ncbi:hypothetical protein JSO61_009355 [Riemerella anatipestifer]|nr:hypothetical protein [Riemerella anatipestifer]MCU7587795.1 hypothetical protein [Riemerella anatipestifer]MCW0499486.1 hypothetical protein [Riemerella anatipestifer]
MTDRVNIINNYIDGYNQFDIKKMVADLDDNIVFKKFKIMI